MYLPNGPVFCRTRRRFHQHIGFDLAQDCILFRNESLLGKISFGKGSSISNNSRLNSGETSISIGKHMMIAPGCVIDAFDHGSEKLKISRTFQAWTHSPTEISDDVWIGTSVTVKGARIGKGSIVAAGDMVTMDMEPHGIVGGVPGRKIGSKLRATSSVGG